MKALTNFLLTLLILSLVALPLMTSTSAAKSGKSSPTSAQTQQLSVQMASGSRSEPATPEDTYRIIFPKEYSKKLSYKLDKGNDREIFIRDRDAEFNSFIKEMNKFGDQNYRLGFVLDSDFPVAVLKSSDKRYEYAWFETDRYPSKDLNDPKIKYSALAEKGFHLFEHDTYTVYCESAIEACDSFENFFLERENGEDTPVRYRFISKGPVQFWHEDKLTSEILKQTSDGLGNGLYPAQALDPYELLLESYVNANKPSTNWQDLQIARDTSIWGADNADNLPKNVNKLAAQGYRLMTVGYGMALMTRPASSAAKPVSYVWVNAGKKDFRQKVERLQAQGAIFRAVYPRFDGLMRELIFELPSVSDGARREYKVLKFALYSAGSAVNGRTNLRIELSPEDTEKKLNDLAREGFVVRALFFSDDYSILLERTK